MFVLYVHCCPQTPGQIAQCMLKCISYCCIRRSSGNTRPHSKRENNGITRACPHQERLNTMFSIQDTLSVTLQTKGELRVHVLNGSSGFLSDNKVRYNRSIGFTALMEITIYAYATGEPKCLIIHTLCSIQLNHLITH